MRKILLLLALLLLPVEGDVYAQSGLVNPTTQMNKAEWPYGSTIWKANGDLDNSTDVSIRTAATGTVHCVTSVQVVAIDSIAADTVVRILSADTVIWQWVVNATTTSAVAAEFPVPICTVSGEALEIDVSTDPADDLVYYNLQGYSHVSP